MTDTSAADVPTEPNEGHGPEVLYEVEDHIATITLNRPHRRNAISTRMLMLLTELFSKADDSPDVRVALLTGSPKSRPDPLWTQLDHRRDEFHCHAD